MQPGDCKTILLLTITALAAALLPIVQGAAPAAPVATWPQWGGPHRNFTVDASGLAETWPPEGPRRIWSRPLGEGYSAISVVDGRLFTMLRRGEQEVAVALDAATGKTIWEYAYDAPFSAEYSMENGPGPHAEPLVAGGRVFTTGATGILHALDAATGKVLWSHNLLAEYNGTLRVNGYACSPIAYGDTVIVMVGGAGHAVMAFRQSDGAVAWQSQDFDNSASSPLLINVDGQDQLVAFLFADIVGLDPRNGALLWSHAHRTGYGLNVTMPVWGGDNLLFLSSTYGGGSRALRLTQSGGKTKVEEVWAH
ncbi:MAG TPA: PQQ-binding-like beta-propeller repeat protein, partial [Candidatus Acidoferrales bacterium]